MAVRDYGFKGSLPVPDSRHYLGKQGAVFRLTMAGLNNTDGYHIYGWMRNYLHLKEPELTIYAIIHAFSQSEKGVMVGGVSTLCAWTGLTPNTVRKYVKILEKKGLIKSLHGDRNGIPFVHFSIVASVLQNLQGIPQNLRDTPQELREGVPQNLRGDTSKFEHRIDNKNRQLGIDIEETGDAPASPSPSRRFTPPTVDEVREYCRSRHNAVNAEAFVAFYTSNGWKVGKNTMKDWKAAVITWEKRDQTHTTPVFTGYTNTRTTAR